METYTYVGMSLGSFQYWISVPLLAAGLLMWWRGKRVALALGAGANLLASLADPPSQFVTLALFIGMAVGLTIDSIRREDSSRKKLAGSVVPIVIFAGFGIVMLTVSERQKDIVVAPYNLTVHESYMGTDRLDRASIRVDAERRDGGNTWWFWDGQAGLLVLERDWFRAPNGKLVRGDYVAMKLQIWALTAPQKVHKIASRAP